MSLPLGCIADDFTGATDLANNLVQAGMRVVQIIGVPGPLFSATALRNVDAVVVALKSRTVEPQEAVSQSLKALKWLKNQGANQVYFKYCSTFDSTPHGNIGPVIEALMDALSSDFTIATPAFPDNNRTVFKGHLFVGDALLSESGMRNHPLTPMTDANLVRVLQSQTRRAVGLIDYAVVSQGSQAVCDRVAQLRSKGIGVAIVDAIDNRDLVRLGAALKGMPLVTGGSGVAIGLPQNFGISPSPGASRLPKVSGLKAIVSGSCSLATTMQVSAFMKARLPAFAVDPLKIAAGMDVVTEALAWAEPRVRDAPALVYSTAESLSIKKVQRLLGVAEAGKIVEETLASIAKGLVALGVKQLIVAGGETSGACVQALGITQMQIGPQIAPGVPWCFASHESTGLHVALKSGNFGHATFFLDAFEMLT